MQSLCSEQLSDVDVSAHCIRNSFIKAEPDVTVTYSFTDLRADARLPISI